jgi:pyruvate,orthophosphate dikinase
LAADGIATILLRASMTPDDVPGMRAAVGIVATSDGITGDAAIVARSLGKPCVASCPRVHVDYVRATVTAWAETPGGPDIVVHRGDTLTIDGGTGEIRIQRA